MTTASDKFEKQIYRIHELLGQDGAHVTWNDKIPDPDNPEQARQIDISIKRDGRLTLVECRIHQKSQDVKWIEELIGRRLSLRADAVIAVSNSGFTEGAALKAKEFGIILRDLQTLTDREIQAWGVSTRVSLTFFEYKNVEITLGIVAKNKCLLIDEVIADLKKTNTLYRIFEMASSVIEEKNPSGNSCRFKGHFKVEGGLSVCGENIDEVKFSADIERIIQHLNIPSVVAYDAPEVPTTQRNVLIEKVAFGDSEITQSSNRVFVAADLTPVKCPPNCQFKYIGFDFGRVVSIYSFELLGLPKFLIPIERIKLGLSIKTNA